MIREPDRYSLDRLLGIRLPVWVGLLGAVRIILTVLFVGQLEAAEPPQQEEVQEEEGSQDEAREELAGP